MLTLSEVAKIFNVTRQTVYNWTRSGYIKAVRVGRQWRVEPKEVERLKRGE